MPKQKGSLLIELAVVVAIVTLMAVGTVAWMVQRAEKTKVESLAVSMLAIQQSLQSLLDTHAFELLETVPFAVEGVSNLQQPTLQELQQLGFLAPSFPLNDTIKMVLYKEGGCPGTHCHIHGLVYSQRPLLTKKQQVDMNAVAQWQSEAKGAGLVVQPASPTRFTGVQLVVEHHALPSGLLFPEGTVALLASTDASIIARGGLSANKNPNFQTDVDVNGSVTMSDDLHVGRYLVLPHTENLGAACSIVGAVARGDDSHGLMSCEEGKWVRPTSSAATSLQAYKEMIRDIWKIPIPDATPGGFYARESVHFSYNCWVPNPMKRYVDGRGQCLCPLDYREQSVNIGGQVNDYYFRNGIGRPRLQVYICV